MLLKLRNYLSKEKVVNLQQMAREFRMDESALEPMLAWWVRQGLIRAHQAEKSCRGACQGCQPNAIAVYEYIGEI